MEISGQIGVAGLTMAASGAESAREDEFTSLVERQSRFVFQVAYSVLRNAHDAEEVVQDTFLKLHRTGAWRGMVDERAFLARAAWRQAVDRRRGRRLDVVSEMAGPSHEQAMIDGDLHGLVHQLMDTLPEELRLPLALAAVEEMTSGEIAGVMGIPEGTVRTRILRARRLLKEKLEQRLERRS